MWTTGSMTVNGIVIHYCIKHYEEPSEFYGINGGRVSKLSLKQSGRIVTNYDRGWDVKPETKEAEIALGILLEKYN